MQALITRTLRNYALATAVVLRAALILTVLLYVGAFIVSDQVTASYWPLSLFIVFCVLIVTAAGVVCTGIPVYAIMKKLNIASLPNLALAGFVIPLVITVALTLNEPVYTDWMKSGRYFGAHRELVVNGHRTYWGWLMVLQTGAIWGLGGLAAAVVFTRKIRLLENEQL